MNDNEYNSTDHTTHTMPLFALSIFNLLLLFFCAPLRVFGTMQEINGEWNINPNFLLSPLDSFKTSLTSMDLYLEITNGVAILWAIAFIIILGLSVLSILSAYFDQLRKSLWLSASLLITSLITFTVSIIFALIHRLNITKGIFYLPSFTFLLLLASQAVTLYINCLATNTLPRRLKPSQVLKTICALGAFFLVTTFAINSFLDSRFHIQRCLFSDTYIDYHINFDDYNYIVDIFFEEEAKDATVVINFSIYVNHSVKSMEFIEIKTVNNGLLFEDFILSYKLRRDDAHIVDIKINAYKKTELNKLTAFDYIALKVNSKRYEFDKLVGGVIGHRIIID